MRDAAGEAALAAGPRALTTARLTLRPFARADVGFLHALWTEPRVRRFLWDDRVISRDEAAAVVEGSLASFAARGFGFWVLHERASERAIGFAGLREFGEVGEIELLYGLDPAWWGRGLASEAARAVLDFGAGQGLARIHAGTDPPNAASIRVIEGLPMRFEGRRLVEGGEALYYVWEREALEDGCPS